jgi:uncharacterized peroxidase-related enzyme
MAIERVAPTGGVEKEPLIPYVEEKDYPASLKPILEPYARRMGFVPNALKLYMHRPEIAEALWKLNSNIMRDPSSTLDQNLKRRLATVASKVNGCAYCTAHHCSMLRRTGADGAEGWSMPETDLVGLLRGEDLPRNEMERACFDYVRAASSDPGAVADEIYDRLKAHLTPAQIIELACVTGFWKMYNTIHDSLRIPIEAHLVDDAEYINA